MLSYHLRGPAHCVKCGTSYAQHDLAYLGGNYYCKTHIEFYPWISRLTPKPSFNPDQFGLKATCDCESYRMSICEENKYGEPHVENWQKPSYYAFYE